MAHNLENRNGKTSFAAVGKIAWHGLGTYVEEAMTAEQVVKLANLDYNVEKTPIYISPKAESGDATLTEFKGIYSTYRTDTNEPLGLVSERYQIVQNSDAFTFFDPIIERGEAIYQTAGVLGKGERVFITAKLPEDIKVAGESVEQYLLITNGHDGKNAVRIGFTPVRVVCNNTLTAALNDLKNSHTIFHFNNPQNQLKEAYMAMGLASRYMGEVSQIFEQMAETKVSDEQLMAYIETLVVDTKYVEKNQKTSTRSKNLTKSIFDFAKHHNTQTTAATNNTLYGAYNSISGYFGHLKQFNSASDRMNSICFGLGASKTNQAFKLASDSLQDISVLDKKLLTV